MYVANVAIISGQVLWFHSGPLLAYAIGIWIAFHLFVLACEEPKLRTTYGREYDDFCAQVPRWIPRLKAPAS